MKKLEFRRSLITSGNSTTVVSLPHLWIKMLGLKAKDKINVRWELETGELHITARKTREVQNDAE